MSRAGGKEEDPGRPLRKPTDATMRVRPTARVAPPSELGQGNGRKMAPARAPRTIPPARPLPGTKPPIIPRATPLAPPRAPSDGPDPGPTRITHGASHVAPESDWALSEGATLHGRAELVTDPVELRHITGQHALTDSEPHGEAGRYTLGPLLGQGGMGQVRLVKDRDIGRHVAMKMLTPGDPDTTALVRALIGEAQTTGQLQHPNIIPVYELGISATGEVFYTMLAVSGMTLKDLMRRLRAGDPELKREYTQRKLLGVFEQICLAMDYAHSSGVVHRDLKPDNVLLGAFGEVLVMDWGIAYVMGRRDDFLAREGVVVGTPHYMAPEQALGQIDRVDGRTDIFSLGVILYELLTLSTPIQETETERALEEVRTLVEPKRPRVGPDGNPVPEALASACVRAMQPDPDDRFPTSRAFYDLIESYLEGSAETERRARMAMEALAIGIQALDRYMELRRTREKLHRKIQREERQVHRWDTIQQKRGLWDLKERYEHIELTVAQAFSAAVQHFHRVIGLVPGQPQARAALTNLNWARFEQTEESGDESGMVYYGERVLKFNDPTQGPLQGGEGKITVRSFPEGAHLRLFDFDGGVPDTRKKQGRALGPAPVHDLQLEMGLYMLVAQKAGYRDARQTIFVRSDGTQTYLLTMNPWTAHDPLVGRAAELNLLKLNFDRVVSGRQVRRVLVTGSDGMGKSRLMTAFTEWIESLPDAILFFFAECHEAHALVPYGALTEGLRIRAGVRPSDAITVAEAKLSAMIESAVEVGGPKTQRDRDLIQRTASTLARLPGMSGEEFEPDASPRDSRRRFDLALMDLIRLMTRWEPALLYFQEVEYMDDASLRVLRKAGEFLAGTQLFVLGFGSDVSIHSGWDETIALGPLTESATHAMLRNLLKAPLPTGLHERVMTRSGGVPWLVADTTRQLAERYELYQVDGKWSLKEGLAPAVRTSMFAARDAMVLELPVRLSRCLQWAAVVGDVFWVEALDAFGVEDAAECCADLTERELIRSTSDVRYPDADAYAFRSLLFREIVYDSNTDPDTLAARHQAVADWMRARFQGDIREVAELARHVELARDEAWAALLYGQLGDACRDVGCFGLARECYQRALNNTGDPDDRGALEERLRAVRPTTERR